MGLTPSSLATCPPLPTALARSSAADDAEPLSAEPAPTPAPLGVVGVVVVAVYPESIAGARSPEGESSYESWAVVLGSALLGSAPTGIAKEDCSSPLSSRQGSRPGLTQVGATVIARCSLLLIPLHLISLLLSSLHLIPLLLSSLLLSSLHLISLLLIPHYF